MTNTIRDIYCNEIEKSGLFSSAEIMSYCAAPVFFKHSFYINLTEFFSPLFSDISNRERQGIAEIGYFFLRSLLAFDTVVDEKILSNLKLGLFNYETAIRKLSLLYPEESAIWTDFKSIKVKYFKGAEIEQSFTLERGCVDFELFEYVAQSKSIFIVLIPKMLSHLSGNYEYIKKLEDSLLYFHVGLQILDDIEDFLIDLEGSQVTFASTSTRMHLRELGIDDKSISNDTLYKYFFVSGVALDHLRLAEKQFNLSLEQVKDLPITRYQNFVFKNGNEQVLKIRKTIEDLLLQSQNKMK